MIPQITLEEHHPMTLQITLEEHHPITRQSTGIDR